MDASCRRELDNLMQQRAPLVAMQAWLARCQPRAGLEPAAWKDLVGALARAAAADYEWLEPGAGRMLRHTAGSRLPAALIEGWPFGRQAIETYSEADLRFLLAPYMDWLVKQQPYVVCNFCWSLLRLYPRRRGSVVQTPLLWLRSAGKLRADLSYEALHLAAALADEEDAMFWWPAERWQASNWDAACLPYLSLLEHDSGLVRAHAAKCLGRLYFGLGHDESRPPLPELLGLISSAESRASSIAGPFLDGGGWGIEDWGPLLGDFDLRHWFLETLRHGKPEGNWPEAQTLAFYAQQFFAADPAAAESLLEMGREDLALDIALQTPEDLDLFRPLIENMARSTNPAVAEAARSFLATHGQKSGKDWLN
jgi:hypothetical protein